MRRITAINNLAEKIKNLTQSVRFENVIILIIGIGLAVAVRWPLLGNTSGDYLIDYKGWYQTIKEMGLGALGTNFADYNPPYLYALFLVIKLFPAIPSVVATKLPSLAADFIGSFFVYKIVKLKYPNQPLPLFGAFAVLFSPTVILNSAYWGQTDSLYTTALLACLYFLLIKENTPAMIAYGVAISFKLQAVFLLPVLLGLLLRREISWNSFLLVPIVMILALVPSWAAGRSVVDLANIYFSQATRI